MSARPMPEPLELGGPWLGLQSYEERHRPLFFGRDAEQDELFRLVERGVLTVLYGVSGLGKTSLLNAGLFPRLREALLLPIPIRLRFGEEAPDPTAQIRAAVAREIAARCSRETTPPDERQTLWEFFHRTPLWNERVRLLTPVLVFDQFEEVLTLGAQDPRTPRLLEALADLIENYIPRSVAERLEASGEVLPFSYDKPKVKVVFSLREDHLAGLQDLRALIPSLMRNSFRLKPMTSLQALEAVIRPAAKAGLEVGADVAERIVRIAAGAEAAPSTPVALEALEVEPVLLSLFCDELNKRRTGSALPTITEELAHGERSRILSDFYDRCTAGEPPEVRRFIEDDLLTKEGHRDTRAEENLPEAMRKALRRLVDSRLLRREERLGRPYVELMHDVLIEPVLHAQTERRRQEAAEAERRREEEERDRERAELKQKVRRARERAAMFAAMFAITFALAILAAYGGIRWERESKKNETALRGAEEEKRQAERAKQDAEEKRIEAWNAEQSGQKLSCALRAAYEAKRENGSELGVLFAIESLKLYPTQEASEVLSSPARTVTFARVRRIAQAAFSADGQQLAIANQTGGVSIWGTMDGLLQRSVIDSATADTEVVTAVAWAPDRQRLAIASADGVRLWERGVRAPLSVDERNALVTAMAFSPDGRLLAVASGSTAKLWDLETRRPRGSFDHGSLVVGVAFGPDGNQIGTGGEDGARIWSVTTGEQVAPLLYPARVMALAFSSDAKRLATGGSDGRVRVWDVERNAIAFQYVVDAVAVAFSPDGRRLLTAGADGRVRFWRATVAEMISAASVGVHRKLTDQEWRRVCINQPMEK